ncbi:serine carboxypeptidase S28 [Oesophagostomum dentatum]|uniref:Serine carboxypeptidase S28 n=1 Tax=Oesophagostomum dentatum TaxID=61180 RepID=A0A0B1TEQ5_OESDE|nr:serine carboxypeptidase S28 [Oesophagostomum dentatum]
MADLLYYYNFKYTNSNKFKYAFLVVGGEGPLRPANDVREIHIVDENNIVVQWAKKYGAALFALEHRFYGESRPKPDTSVENLKYLNSRQAIEDIAYFINEMNKEYGSPDSVWVTFGASYAGSLALWARQAHPDLIAGAVGSSAPLEITLDFWGLKDGVGDAFRSQSERCADNIGKAFTEMSDMMKFELGRMKLQELFALVSHLTFT